MRRLHPFSSFSFFFEIKSKIVLRDSRSVKDKRSLLSTTISREPCPYIAHPVESVCDVCL